MKTGSDKRVTRNRPLHQPCASGVEACLGPATTATPAGGEEEEHVKDEAEFGNFNAA